LRNFGYLVAGGPGEGENYQRSPVLSFISPSAFTKVMLALDPEQFRGIMQHMDARYKGGALDHTLNAERAWLVEVRDKMLHKAARMPRIRNAAIKQMVERHINPHL
jgi:hypothetical protein